jgi:hypothetical protein
MKKFLVLSIAVAFIAVPMVGNAKGHKKASKCYTATTYVQPCAQTCINPLAPVAGVVRGVGAVVEGVFGIFSCSPCASPCGKY